MTSSTPVATRLTDKPHRTAVLGVLGLMTAIAFESFAVATALPVVARDLGAGQWYSLAFAATISTGLVGMTLGGGWADRRGVALPLTVGGAMFVAGIALCVAAPSMWVFILGRLLQGVGGGIDAVVIYVVIAQLVPEELRTRMFGLLTAAWLVPGIVGPLAAGALIDVVHWRAVFLAVLGLAAMSLVVLVRGVPGTAPVRIDGRVLDRSTAWAVLAAAGALALHHAPRASASLALAGTVAAATMVLVAASRLLPSGTLVARRGPARLIALKGVLGATVAATDIYLPLYLQNALGYSPTRSGLVVAIGAVGWVSGAWLQGRSAEPAGHPMIIAAASCLVVLGPVSAFLLVVGVVPVACTVAGCVLMGVGMGLAYPQVTAGVLRMSAVDQQGTNSAALQVAESLAIAALVAITGLLLNTTTSGGFTLTYAAVLAVGIGGLLLALRSWTDRERTADVNTPWC